RRSPMHLRRRDVSQAVDCIAIAKDLKEADHCARELGLAESVRALRSQDHVQVADRKKLIRGCETCPRVSQIKSWKCALWRVDYHFELIASRPIEVDRELVRAKRVRTRRHREASLES